MQTQPDRNATHSFVLLERLRAARPVTSHPTPTTRRHLNHRLIVDVLIDSSIVIIVNTNNILSIVIIVFNIIIHLRYQHQRRHPQHPSASSTPSSPTPLSSSSLFPAAVQVVVVVPKLSNQLDDVSGVGDVRRDQGHEMQCETKRDGETRAR